MADYSKLSRNELISLCKEKNLKGYSTKKKADLINLLQETAQIQTTTKDLQSSGLGQTTKKVGDKVQRLDYIGSKFQLLDWITSTIQEKTGWTSLADKRIADLFGGTGIVSHHFRTLGSTVISNDAELFSSIITSAFTKSVYNDKCKVTINTLNNELKTGKKLGYVTKNYSPYESCERKFFTVENAQKIDYVRERIEELRNELCEQDYTFILASLIVSADAVSNVPAVYGCYLKNFKAKAQKDLKIIPVHTMTTVAHQDSKTFNQDVLSDELLGNITVDAVYLDPPYNERQYSKNYFPLNIIAKTPTELLKEPELKGKTGIPTDCFISPFCKKGKVVEAAFEKLFKNLKTNWIFLSYNSESLVSKSRMIELMEKCGDVSVLERDYKRFKSFKYNEDKDIKEYLFCLKVRSTH